MFLRVAAQAELVQVFEARVLNEGGQVLFAACASSAQIAEGMAREADKSYRLGGWGTDASADAVERFRVAVLDDRNRPMYFGYGRTEEEARAQAAFWIARDTLTLH
jgi:hypothetical protein